MTAPEFTRVKSVTVRGDLSSVATFNYNAKIGFEPNYCVVNKIRYYNTGTDTSTFLLSSSLFSADGNFGATFTEAMGLACNTPHKLEGQINNVSFQFSIANTNSAGSAPGGSVDIDLIFYYCPALC